MEHHDDVRDVDGKVPGKQDVRRHGAVFDGEVLAVAEEPVANGERRRASAYY